MGKMNETLSKFVCNKKRLKEKIDQERKREKREMKKYQKPLLGFACLAIIIGLVMIPMFLKPDKKLKIEYTKYLTESKILKETDKNYDKKIKESYKKLQNKEITEDEYFKETEKIRTDKNKLKNEQSALKTKYSLKEDLDLETVNFSKDKNIDKKLKDLYLENEKLEQKDDDLDLLEEELEKKYINNQITKEEFEAQIANIESQEAELEALEEAIDAKEDALEKEEEAAEDKENDDDLDTD